MCILYKDVFGCGHEKLFFTDECDDAPSCGVEDERENHRGTLKCPECVADEKREKKRKEKERVNQQKLKRQRSGESQRGEAKKRT